MDQDKNWIITDGEYFVYKNYKGKYVYSKGESMAECFSRSNAENILKHHINKNIRKRFRVERKRNQNAIDKPITQQDFQDGFEKVMSSDYTEKWLEKLECYNGLMDEARERKKLLIEQLSRIDSAINSLAHFSETSKVNASQGWYFWDMYSKGNQKRRSIKNEIIVIDAILDSNIGKKSCESIKNRIAGLDNRKYSPKELSDLFSFHI